MSETDPLGPPLDRLPPGLRPDGRALEGNWVTVRPLDPARDAEPLYRSFADSDPEGRVWSYLAYGPFASRDAFAEWLQTWEGMRDPYFQVFVPRASGKPAGMGSFMRITPEHGVIEIGHIWFSPPLQRSREATEALYLMMRHCFEDLGNRRLEWKCDALNAASRRAADRLGFAFEGIFRQHNVVKGRNRDTAWYAMLDGKWPEMDAAFRTWLGVDNFDAAGRQKTSLSELTAKVPRR